MLYFLIPVIVLGLILFSGLLLRTRQRLSHQQTLEDLKNKIRKELDKHRDTK